jgi:uncharacterized membrane protein YhhN
MPVAPPDASLRRTLPFIGLVAAALAIASAPWALDQPWLNVVFKPLATLCVIGWAALGRSDDAVVTRWILAGLGFSLAGDIALLWPVSGFLVGLVAFLFAHLSYLVALTRRTPLLASRQAASFWVIVAGSLLVWLWPGVPGELRAPVLVYVCALAAMAAQASSVWLAHRGAADAPHWRAVAAGAALFVLSDAILAADKFVGGVPLPTLWNLVTYWLAQWLIATAALSSRRG